MGSDPIELDAHIHRPLEPSFIELYIVKSPNSSAQITLLNTLIIVVQI